MLNQIRATRVALIIGTSSPLMICATHHVSATHLPRVATYRPLEYHNLGWGSILHHVSLGTKHLNLRCAPRAAAAAKFVCIVRVGPMGATSHNARETWTTYTNITYSKTVCKNLFWSTKQKYEWILSLPWKGGIRGACHQAHYDSRSYERGLWCSYFHGDAPQNVCKRVGTTAQHHARLGRR